MAEAVAASCAIPGFYHPVRIGRLRYVDGGVRSASNLDLLAGPRPGPRDLPQPDLHRGRAARAPGSDRVAGAMRAAAGRRLGHEAKRVRAGGTEVVLIQPVAEDLAVMGTNLMSGRRRHEVIETAVGTVTEALASPSSATGWRDCRRASPTRSGARRVTPPTWPEFLPAAGRRAA